jgi:ferric-dicitrate binding protein FerR (iron transport regulator)
MSPRDHACNEEAAALWFAKCRRGVMAVEERAAFEAWKRDSANAAALAELERVWDLLEGGEAHIASVPAPMPRQRIARSALLAVMCAVSIGIGVISYSGNHEFWTALDWVER